jgi:hypothetical protein
MVEWNMHYCARRMMLAKEIQGQWITQFSGYNVNYTEIKVNTITRRGDVTKRYNCSNKCKAFLFLKTVNINAPMIVVTTQ